MEIVAEDGPDLFSSWLDARLTGLATGIAREARRWAVTLHDGGPRTAPRSPHTARAYLRATLPALQDWSARYDHLREVTRDDVLGYIAGLCGHERTRRYPRCGPCSPGRRSPASSCATRRRGSIFHDF